MTIGFITTEAFDRLSDIDRKVCVFCDEITTSFFCSCCGEYKGLMTIADWEDYTGEEWED